MVGQPVIIEVAINGLKSKRENPNVPDRADRDRRRGAGVHRGRCRDRPQPHRSLRPHRGRGGRALPGGLASGPGRTARRAALPDGPLRPTASATSTRCRSPPAASPGSASSTRARSTSAASTRTACRPAASSTPTPTTPSPGRSRSAREHRLGPSMAIYEPGFLQTVVAWWRAGRLPAGLDDQALLLARTRATWVRRSACRRRPPRSTPTSRSSTTATCRGRCRWSVAT